MSLEIEWSLKKFTELTSGELYQLLRLRSAVFVVEQASVFLDLDDKDQYCAHLMGTRRGQLLAYSRIVPAGVTFEYASLGRIVVAQEGRGQGLGKMLMDRSISELEEKFGAVPIQIGAQTYLRAFYGNFRFVPCSEPYIEDGIEHIEMVRFSKTVE
jgi:ElaA protein